MSNADRLRAAAHILDTVSHPTPFSTTCAALLRAVADDIEDWRTRLEGPGPDPAPYGIPTRGWDAARALADVILGASDE